MRARLGAWAGTVVVGALLGYVLTSFMAPMIADSALFGGTGEVREARDYMLGLLSSDPELLASVTPGRSIVQRAAQMQGQAPQANFRPMSLTFIGGRSIGPFTLQAYAVEMRPARGPDRFFPLVLTLINGKVVRSD